MSESEASATASATAKTAGAENGVLIIAGATSASGEAVARAATASGRRVLALSRNPAKLDALRGAVHDIETRPIDLADAQAVAALHDDLRAAGTRVAGIVHLVGGWRGSDDGIAGQSEEDWQFLETALTSLRHLSREFDRELAEGPRGRLIAVSSTAVGRPRASMASDVALKSARETWMLAVADGFAGTDAAASVIVVKSLGGNEAAFAELVVEILDAEAGVVNGQRIRLR